MTGGSQSRRRFLALAAAAAARGILARLPGIARGAFIDAACDLSTL